MTETWRDVRGYEGVYQVSNLGNVRSLDRTVTYRDGRIAHFKGIQRRPVRKQDGYLHVMFSNGTGTEKSITIHRLVALAFVPNPDGLPEVNHKDEDKENNRADNLEWCDRLQNCRHGTRGLRISRANNKPIVLTNGEERIVFNSQKQAAAQLGVKSQSIGYAMAHGTKCRGYRCEFIQGKDVIEVDGTYFGR